MTTYRTPPGGPGSNFSPPPIQVGASNGFVPSPRPSNMFNMAAGPGVSRFGQPPGRSRPPLGPSGPDPYGQIARSNYRGEAEGYQADVRNAFQGYAANQLGIPGPPTRPDGQDFQLYGGGGRGSQGYGGGYGGPPQYGTDQQPRQRQYRPPNIGGPTSYQMFQPQNYGRPRGQYDPGPGPQRGQTYGGGNYQGYKGPARNAAPPWLQRGGVAGPREPGQPRRPPGVPPWRGGDPQQTGQRGGWGTPQYAPRTGEPGGDLYFGKQTGQWGTPPGTRKPWEDPAQVRRRVGGPSRLAPSPRTSPPPGTMRF